MTKEQLLAEAMKLNPFERDELAESLWQSSSPDDLTPEQVAEIRGRIQAIDTGEAQLVPGEQVMRELFERFRR